MVESLRASDDATKRAAAGLKDYDAAAGKAASGAGRTRAAIEANTAATLRLTDALDKLKLAQASTEIGGASMAASIGLSTALFSRGIDLAVQFAVGLKDLAVNASSLAEAQTNTAVRTGLTVREVGLFEAAAKEAGISANAYTLAMRTLSGALSQNDEDGKKAKRALAELGVQARDSNGVLRPMRDIWVEVASAIGAVDDPAKRARLAIDLLGRAGIELLPQLTSEMGTVLTELERMGVGFSDAGVKAANNFGNALDRMKTAWDKWYQDVGVRFAEFVGYGASAPAKGGAMVVGGGFGVFAPGLTEPDRATPARESVRRELDRAKEVARARQRKADEEAINATLERQETLQSKLSDARKSRDEAARTVDRAAFDRANAEVRGLEARIEGERRYKEAIAERNREQKEALRKLEADLKRVSDVATKRASDATGKLFDGAYRLYGGADVSGDLAALNTRADSITERFTGSRTFRLPSPGGRNADLLAGASAAAITEGVKLWDLEREHRLRMIELTAGPGGELAAAREVYRVRLDGARTEMERQEARVRFEERVAALAQERLRKYEETAGRVYDSLKQGGGGLRDFGRGQLDILQRQIFVNASSSIFQRAGGVLGQIGAASGLGGLLRGTIFDPANAQPLDKNTLALQRVSTSLDRLNGAISGTPTVLGGDGSYSTPAGVLQGGTGLVMSLLGGKGGSSSTNVGGIFGFAGGGPQQLTRNQRIAGGVGAAALGAYGIYSGIQQGGAGGFLTAAGGALGAASAIPGPQQPFLQGAALVMGFLGSIFGGNKAQKYEEKQSRMLDAARYAGPTGRDVVGDRYGNAIDYDYRGNVRVIERPVYVQVQAFDSRSIIDARQDIAAAVREAIREGSDLSDTVRDLTMPR